VPIPKLKERKDIIWLLAFFITRRFSSLSFLSGNGPFWKDKEEKTFFPQGNWNSNSLQKCSDTRMHHRQKSGFWNLSSALHTVHAMCIFILITKVLKILF
jgi:hypothetical protein